MYLPRPTMIAEFELSAVGAARLRNWFDALRRGVVSHVDVVAAIQAEFPT